MIPLLLSVTAIIAYVCGSLRSDYIASNLIFHRDLLRYSRDNTGITRFLKDFGKLGAIKLLLVEIAKIVLPVLIGGWLLSIEDHADIGRAFALLCAMLGCIFPILYRFRGESTLVLLPVGMMIVNGEVGFLGIAALAGVYLLTHYVSLAAISSALVMVLVSLMAVDALIVRWLILGCAILVILEYRHSIPRLIRGTEPKFIYKKDISYMFDD